MLYAGALVLLLAWAPPGEELRKLVDTALAAPPETAADALIQLASSPAVQDRAYAIDLLHRASTLASSAAHPYRKGGGVGAAQGTDTDAGRLSQALAPGLDGHSLQVRAARALFQIDRVKGAEAFFQLRIPQFPPLSCRDSMVWRTGDYYDLVREVFESGFTAVQKREGRNVAMLEDQVRALTSPFQLEPLTRMLVHVQVTDAQFERLVAVFATALKTLRVDDRSFTTGTRHGFTQALFELMARCRRLGMSTLPLVDAYKTYLQSGLTAKRCEDSADPKGEGASIQNMVQLLNGELSKMGEEPLVVSARDGQIIAERAEVYVFWSSPVPRKLFGQMVALLRREEKSGDEWERLVREFLVQLNDWEKDHGETTVNYFHQRAMLYSGLLRAMPAGALKSSVAKDYVGFLLSSTVERQSPPEWYLYARDLVNLTGEEEMRRSGHPGLQLTLDLPRTLRAK